MSRRVAPAAAIPVRDGLSLFWQHLALICRTHANKYTRFFTHRRPKCVIQLPEVVLQGAFDFWLAARMLSLGCSLYRRLFCQSGIRAVQRRSVSQKYSRRVKCSWRLARVVSPTEQVCGACCFLDCKVIRWSSIPVGDSLGAIVIMMK